MHLAAFVGWWPTRLCQPALPALPMAMLLPPQWVGWDRGYQGTVPSCLCFTSALLGAGKEFGWGWAFPCSDSPGQDLALMTVLCGEEIPEELLTAHWGMM